MAAWHTVGFECEQKQDLCINTYKDEWAKIPPQWCEKLIETYRK